MSTAYAMLTGRVELATIADTFGILGVKPPKPLDEAFARMRRLDERADNLAVDAKLPGLVVAAAEAGRDPATDPEVQRVFLASQIANDWTRDILRGAGREGVTSALREHEPAIIAEWSKVFDRAAAVLVDAYDKLGVDDLDDSKAVLRKGGAAAKLWAEAQGAVGAIQAAAAGANAIDSLVGRGPAPSSVLRIADIEPEAWKASGFHGRADVHPWEVVTGGYRLSLADRAELTRRRAALREYQEQQDRAKAEARKARAFA